MSEISDYSRRINEALERIDRAAASLNPGGGDGDGAAARARLEAELEAERSARAELAAQLQSGAPDGAAAPQGETRAQLDTLSREVARLKSANAALMQANAALREAAEDGGADGDLLSRSMTAELEALRAERRAEAAEMQEILDALAPLIAEDRNA